MAVDISEYLDIIAGESDGEEVIQAIHDASLALGTDTYKTADIEELLENIKTKVFGIEIRMDIYEILKRLSEAAPTPPAPVPSGEVLYGTSDYVLAESGTFADNVLFGAAENYPPRLEGLTNIYDCRYGLTTDAWINRIPSGGDVAWTGMTMQQDGSALVNCTESSYGIFDSHDISYHATIYAVFKGPLRGVLHDNRHVVGSMNKNNDSFRQGYWTTISVDGFEGNDAIGIDAWGIGTGSSINCSEYHVVVVRRHFADVYLWIDGVSQSSIRLTSITIGSKFGIGCIGKPNGNIIAMSQGAPIQVKFVAVSNNNDFDEHEGERIVENSLWLMQQFGIGG